MAINVEEIRRPATKERLKCTLSKVEASRIIRDKIEKTLSNAYFGLSEGLFSMTYEDFGYINNTAGNKLVGQTLGKKELQNAGLDVMREYGIDLIERAEYPKVRIQTVGDITREYTTYSSTKNQRLFFERIIVYDKDRNKIEVKWKAIVSPLHDRHR